MGYAEIKESARNRLNNPDAEYVGMYADGTTEWMTKDGIKRIASQKGRPHRCPDCGLHIRATTNVHESGIHHQTAKL